MIPLTLLTDIATYSFPTGAAQQYDLAVVFDGFLPLMGGQNSKIEVTFGLAAKGEDLSADKKPQVSIDLTTFEAKLEGSPLPFTADNVKAYLPKTTLSYAPTGKVLKSNAPDLVMPVRLPGLDAKHLPELTILPIEFPEGGEFKEGTKWKFEKPLGDGVVKYEVTIKGIKGNTVDLALTATQELDYLEDEGLQVPTDPKKAVSKVHTSLAGTGSASFDLAAHHLTTYHLGAVANSKVTNISKGTQSDRVLNISLDMKAHEGKVVSNQVAAAAPTWQQQAWAKAKLGFQMASMWANKTVQPLLANLFAMLGLVPRQ